MRVIPFLVSAIITLALVWALSKPWGSLLPMPLGSFLSPQTGFWQNAEATNHSFDEAVQFPQLKSKAHVYFDERLVPHVFAENDEDLFFVQGYLHAKFRLFQMDLQTKAAEGRASEIGGEKAINYDKEQRRLGMKYGAEHSLLVMEQNETAKSCYSAYTDGVNAYIHSLSPKDLPLEYKLLNFQPEEWTNLRTALLLKMMAKMLSSGTESDLAYTNLKTFLSDAQINALYPQVPDSLKPIVPKGTVFPIPAIQPKMPVQADSAYFGSSPGPIAFDEVSKPNKDNGSNNWVVAGSRTAKGAPILANDPHLEMSLPSIWYEMQLSTPQFSVYGVSLPGSPNIIIGFNDSIAWGVTNAQRDVKDYYSIKFKNEHKKEYWYNNEWQPTKPRIETIKVKGGATVYDTVYYTVFGPVMFDNRYRDEVGGHTALAVKWAAHETGDDGFTFFKLNRASNYTDYVEAIKTFECPGQNFVFASHSGDIAVWQQGKFPARWPGQGRYVMPGTDSSYMWQGSIPQKENPHALNPARGFLFSANQRPTDATYPYYIPGAYLTPRGIAIEHFLSQMNQVTPQQMMDLQNNYFNVIAEDMRPLLLKYTDEPNLSPDAKKYWTVVKDWDLMAGPASLAQTVYKMWFDSLQRNIWFDEISKAGVHTAFPDQETTLELWERDSTLMGFVDNVNTPEVETIRQQVTQALNLAAPALAVLEKEGRWEWAKFKDVSIFHLLGQAALPFARTGLNVGGWSDIINAVTKSHGPSWRMVVQMGAPVEAYGVYPGGQSGNPGSRFYDDMVDSWVQGKYYPLWLMRATESKDPRVKWVMNFGK